MSSREESTNSNYEQGGNEACHEYLKVHGIYTHVIKCGHLLPDDAVKTQKLVLIVPGNPGAVDFYLEFMETIHRGSGWPVWGISHAGHSVIPKHIHRQDIDDQVFTLEGQIQHKIHFINHFIPKNTELVLIGHSIGAYVVLAIMKAIESERILQGMLLFPTIERMSVSPQGARLTPVLKYWRWLIISFAWWLSWFPRSWRESLVDNFVQWRSRVHGTQLPQCISRGIMHVIDPYCLSNALYLAHKEMQKVTHLELETVSQLLPKLRFYYGSKDHWCPIQYYEDMRQNFPDHPNIQVCADGFRHAFIIDASRPMGEKVSRWLMSL